MDAQYPFASRDDIWRVFDELKDLHVAQLEQAERIAKLERRRDEDARLRSVWGPLSPFPTTVGGPAPTGMLSDTLRLLISCPWRRFGWLTVWACLQSQHFIPPPTLLRDSIKDSTTG